MDINKLSQKMYENIPFGGSLFTIDKIGLRMDRKNIILENYKMWKSNNYITILIFGEYVHINIHSEFMPFEKNNAFRCLCAIFLLCSNSVFTSYFSLKLILMFNKLSLLMLFNKSYYGFFLSLFFDIVEIEWATDFLDIYPFSFIDTNNNNPKSFKKYRNTFYSKDGKKTLRTVEKNGKIMKEVKGVQKSFVDIYDKGIKIGSERKITRMEIRQQGKHKKDLSFELINDCTEKVFDKILPIVKKQINKVVGKDILQLNEHWNDNPPEQYKRLFIE